MATHRVRQSRDERGTRFKGASAKEPMSKKRDMGHLLPVGYLAVNWKMVVVR
jgi:hypothetical protein